MRHPPRDEVNKELVGGLRPRQCISVTRDALLHLCEHNVDDRCDMFAVQRMENAVGVPSASGKNLDAVQRALEAGGVTFTNGDEPGVKLRRRE